MNSTDEELQAELARALPPEDLAMQSDAELEAMLDAVDETPEHAHHGGSPWWGIAAAAAAVVVLIGIVAIKRAEVKPDQVVESKEDSGGTIELPAPEHVGTPEPQVAKEKDWVEITPEFPRPIATNGPLTIARPNLEKPLKPRLAFKAPPGTNVISRGAAVTSSSAKPFAGDLSMITDGDKGGAEGGYVELERGKQWVQIDLGERLEIWNLVVWHFLKKARAYDDVVIQLSDDPDFGGFVRTAFNNDHDDSSGMGVGEDPAWLETNHGRIIDVGGVVARYIRLYSNGNTATAENHYVEVEVWGK